MLCYSLYKAIYPFGFKNIALKKSIQHSKTVPPICLSITRIKVTVSKIFVILTMTP